MSNEKKIIYTSYYAVQKQLPKLSQQYATSVKIPEWWKPDWPNMLKELAPNPKWMKAEDWKDRYHLKMRRMVKSGELQEIVDRIPPKSILMCFEKDEKKCHRSIALVYMIKYCGVEGGEFPIPEGRNVSRRDTQQCPLDFG